MSLNIDLTGTVAVVTGVTSGIGAGIAGEFARAGASLVGCGRRPGTDEGALAFVETAERQGVEALYVRRDVSDADGPRSLITAAMERFGRLDYVISNAGRNVFTGVDATTLSEWQECMDLNLRSHWLLAQAAAPHLRAAAELTRPESAGGPVFLVDASNHAYSTMPGCFPYNTNKAALIALVQSLAIEWGPEIRAVGLAPGYIETEGARSWFESFSDPAEERRRTEALHPAGRLGTPEEVGGICVFLASRYAAFITGSTILADGGRSALMQDGVKEYR